MTPSADGDDDQSSSSFELVRMQRDLWSGPLPSPTAMQQFGEVNATFPERIMHEFEAEADHRRSLESQELQAAIHDRRSHRAQLRRGQWMGFTLAVVMLGLGSYLITAGHPAWGGTMATTSLVSIVTVFVVGRVGLRERNEPEQEHG